MTRAGFVEGRVIYMNIHDQQFDTDKRQVRDAVESYLTDRFAEYPATEVRAAAQYAVLGGGHRWRPIVAVAAGSIFNNDALPVVLPGACGAELAHAASLVLDDLPSMDDAPLRRGKESTHLAFPGWAVDMTPVFLVTMAYDISLDNDLASADRRVLAALELSRAGMAMIAGQSLDVLQIHTGDPSATLLDCYLKKSGVLYGAAAKAGAILCGADEDDAELLRKAGEFVGLSMQLIDDIADVDASLDEVGKEPGKDVDKFTSIDWLGVDGTRGKSEEFQADALALLAKFGKEADWMRRLVREVSWANY